MSFDEAQHVRDTGGRFAHRQGTDPEVSLTTSTPYAGISARLDEVQARVAEAEPGSVGENPAYWFDKDEMLDAVGGLPANPVAGGIYQSIQQQPVQYLEWYFRQRATNLSEAAARGGASAKSFHDAARSYQEMSALASAQSSAIAGERTRINNVPDIPDAREYDALSVSSARSALDKILSVPVSKAGDMNFTYDRPTDGEGDHVIRVRNISSAVGYDRIIIDYANKKSDTLGRQGAEFLARRLAMQEDYNARQEGVDPRTRLH